MIFNSVVLKSTVWIALLKKSSFISASSPYHHLYFHSSSVSQSVPGMSFAVPCSTLAWKIPWTEEPGGLPSTGSLELDTTEQLHFHFSVSCIGEGNGNPLQCSCLENPRDSGAWWAAVYGVAQSQTWLKWLSSSSSSSMSFVVPCTGLIHFYSYLVRCVRCFMWKSIFSVITPSNLSQNALFRNPSSRSCNLWCL